VIRQARLVRGFGVGVGGWGLGVGGLGSGVGGLGSGVEGSGLGVWGLGSGLSALRLDRDPRGVTLRQLRTEVEGRFRLYAAIRGRGLGCRVQATQGYLAHRKHPHRRTLQ